MPLRRRQRMIIANQNNVGGVQSIVQLLRVEKGIVRAECLVELPQIFPPAMRILRPNLALHSRQRRKLRRAPS